MNQPQSQSDEWRPCPPKTLTVLSSVLKRRQRWNRIQRIVTISAAVLIITAAGTYMISHQPPQQTEHIYAGISCQDVSQTLSDFIAGKVDDERRLKIEAHLELCSSCRRLENQLRAQQQASASRSSANEVQLTSLDRNGR